MTNGTTQPPWLKAVATRSETATSMPTPRGQPYAPTSGPAYQAWQKALTAAASKVTQPASQWNNDSDSIVARGGRNLIGLAAWEARHQSVRLQPGHRQDRQWQKRRGHRLLVVRAVQAGAGAGQEDPPVGAVGQTTFDQWRNSPGEVEIVKSDGQTAVATYTAQQVAAAR